MCRFSHILERIFIFRREIQDRVLDELYNVLESLQFFLLNAMILSCDSKGKRVVIKTALATVAQPTGHSLVFLGHLQAPSFFTCDTSLNFDSGERRCVPNHKRPRTRRRKTSITRSQGPCTLSFPCLHHTYFFLYTSIDV